MEEIKNDVLFGTEVFGGFNRKNVMDYIEKLQTKLAECGGAEAELADAKKQIRALTDALARADAEKTELLEKLEAQPTAQETSVLAEQVTQLKAQLRVEQAENELLREKMQGQDVEEPVPQNAPQSLDEVDVMVQEIIR